MTAENALSTVQMMIADRLMDSNVLIFVHELLELLRILDVAGKEVLSGLLEGCVAGFAELAADDFGAWGVRCVVLGLVALNAGVWADLDVLGEERVVGECFDFGLSAISIFV
jgi:hypothetical protein